MILAILKVLSIPIMALNFGGVVVGAVWLAYLGQWVLLGIGFTAMMLSSLQLKFLLAPGLLFSVPGIVAIDRGYYTVGMLCVFASNLWHFVVTTVWCIGSFLIVIGNHYHSSGSLWPYLLWAYGVATGPWAYIAAREGRDAIGTAWGAFGTYVGAMAIMGVYLFKVHPSIIETTVAFCIPVSVVLVLQTVMAFQLVIEQRQVHT
jgi:hypothetical protein